MTTSLLRPLAIGQRLAVAVIGQEDDPDGEGGIQPGECEEQVLCDYDGCMIRTGNPAKSAWSAVFNFLRRSRRRSTMKMNLLTKSSDNTRGDLMRG